MPAPARAWDNNCATFSQYFGHASKYAAVGSTTVGRSASHDNNSDCLSREAMDANQGNVIYSKEHTHAEGRDDC